MNPSAYAPIRDLKYLLCLNIECRKKNRRTFVAFVQTVMKQYVISVLSFISAVFSAFRPPASRRFPHLPVGGFFLRYLRLMYFTSFIYPHSSIGF